MERALRLPAIGCPECKGQLNLIVDGSGLSLDAALIQCDSCSWELDLLETTRNQYAVNRDRARRVAGEVSESISEARRYLPKDKTEWESTIRNPRHPFTAAIIAGVALVAMELSGFGIFMAVTWILGNLILNPFGWVMVPLVVAVAFMYRDSLRRDK